MTTNKSVTLSKGYHFVYHDIHPEEINKLRRKFDWNPDTPEKWRTCMDESIFSGIRYNQELVGIGFIAGNSRHGVLCDLSVDPQHEDRGLAKSLVNELLQLAKQKGMKYFYLHMSTPSPLREEYLSLGFRDTGGSLFRNDTLA